MGQLSNAYTIPVSYSIDKHIFRYNKYNDHIFSVLHVLGTLSRVAYITIFSAIYDDLYDSIMLRALSTIRTLHAEHSECKLEAFSCFWPLASHFSLLHTFVVSLFAEHADC